MDGTRVFTARLVELRESPHGRAGVVSVGGARLEVALDLVPDVEPGECVLVHAGVALSRVRDTAEPRDAKES